MRIFFDGALNLVGGKKTEGSTVDGVDPVEATIDSTKLDYCIIDSTSISKYALDIRK